MNDLNQLILEGDVYHDFQVCRDKSGTAVCEIPVAVKRSYRSVDGVPVGGVAFFDVKVKGRLAELCGKYGKGQHVRIVGKLQQEQWQQDGKNFSKTCVAAEHVEFVKGNMKIVSNMNDLNQIILEGDVYHDFQVSRSMSGAAVCEIPVAVKRSYRSVDGVPVDEVAFFDVKAAGNLAEMCGKCGKGQHVRIVGRLQQERWRNEDGRACAKICVTAEHVDFCGINRRNDVHRKKESGGIEL